MVVEIAGIELLKLVCHYRNLSETMIVSPGPNDVAQRHPDFLLLSVDNAHDFDAGGGAAIGHATRERERLQHGRRPLLHGVRARVLHLAEDIDALGARHEDGVAVAKGHIVREDAVLQLLQIHAHDVVALGTAGSSGSPGVCPPVAWTITASPLAVGSVDPARASASTSFMSPEMG